MRQSEIVGKFEIFFKSVKNLVIKTDNKNKFTTNLLVKTMNYV